MSYQPDLSHNTPSPGDTRTLLIEYDWTRTPLGPRESWPQALRTVVNLVLDSKFPMFLAWGSELNFIYNDAYAQILGAKHPAAMGQRFEKIWSEIWPEISPIVENALAGNSAFFEDLPLTVLRKEYPEQAWFTFSYSPVHIDDHTVAGMYCTVVETTNRVRAEEALRQADRRKDEFLAMLAHELRNPLAPISAAAELIGMGRLDPARLKQTSAIITRQVGHMTELVDDLLDVSRVTRGLVTIDKTAQDMRAIVANAVEQVRPLISAQNHTLTVAQASAPAFVAGDQKRLVQILSNLLNNAAKYTPSGGQIELLTEIDSGRVSITVRDSGIGIAPDLQGRVFELFAQAERSSDRSQGGLGLGLALVKSLTELHGGTVSCRSDGLGKGAAFTVVLPRLSTPESDVAPSQSATDQPAAAGLSILIVDDNTDAAQMLALFLQALGHRVEVEHASLQALESARNLRPDVCLLDVGLPGMDGNELARRLHADDETAHSILIAISGYGQQSDRQLGLAAGFDHYLVKPVNTDELAKLLRSIANSKPELAGK